MGRFLLRNLPLAAEPWACCLCPTCLQYPDRGPHILGRLEHHFGKKVLQFVLCYSTTAELLKAYRRS